MNFINGLIGFFNSETTGEAVGFFISIAGIFVIGTLVISLISYIIMKLFPGG